MRAAYVAFGLATLSCSADEHQCDLPTVLSSQLTQQDNCGTFDAPYSEDSKQAWLDARACVMTHLAANQPFYVSWPDQPTDYLSSTAYLAVPGNGGLSVSGLSYTKSQRLEQTTQFACGAFMPTPTCDSVDLRSRLCFFCSAGPIESTCSD